MPAPLVFLKRGVPEPHDVRTVGVPRCGELLDEVVAQGHRDPFVGIDLCSVIFEQFRQYRQRGFDDALQRVRRKLGPVGAVGVGFVSWSDTSVARREIADVLRGHMGDEGEFRRRPGLNLQLTFHERLARQRNDRHFPDAEDLNFIHELRLTIAAKLDAFCRRGMKPCGVHFAAVL